MDGAWQELYNAVNFKPSGGKNGNEIGITGYLEQFANIDGMHINMESSDATGLTPAL